jgi:hypothetical protein
MILSKIHQRIRANHNTNGKTAKEGYKVIVKPGKLNAGLDHLSRVTNGEEPMNLKDNFLDAHLFSIHIVDDYFAEIIQYLSTGTAPQDYTTTQKKNLVVRAADYQLIGGHLYKMGADSIL